MDRAEPNTELGNKLISRRDLIRWGGAGALTALLGGTYGVLQSSAIVVERHELRLQKWDADGFRVAVLSDVHANDAVAAARTKNAVRLALDEKPDLIVLPGDFVNFSWSYTLDTMIESLAELREANCPVIGTLGNHDYWTHNPPKVIRALKERTNMQLLMNERADVRGVTIAGVDDAIAEKHRPGFIERLDNKSILVLLHEPDFVKDVPVNASVQISGHSHGGQICLPFGIPYQTPRGSWKYQKGFYPDARVPLYVSRGIGNVFVPIRLFCPPEVSLLTLRSAA
jgi:uncharacterized protein